MIENGCLYKEYELPPVNDREALRYAGATENDPQAMSLLAEAKADGNETRVARLEQLLHSVDIKRISTDSETVVNGFSKGLNAM